MKKEDFNILYSSGWDIFCIIFESLHDPLLDLVDLALDTVLHTLWSKLVHAVFLALVFGLGHNGMALYNADTQSCFRKLQVHHRMTWNATIFR